MNIPKNIVGSAVAAVAMAVITVVSAVSPAGASSTGGTARNPTGSVRSSSSTSSKTELMYPEYFSNFEQPGSADIDEWQNTYAAGCTSGCSPLSTGSHEYDEATTSTPNAFQPTEPMATALCQVDADEVNSFIDWYSQNVSPVYPQPGYPGNDTQTPYSESNPYFGPWYGSFPDLSDAALQFGEAPTSGSKNDGDQSACNTKYWITGDTFNGPVASHDELTTCGTPLFEGDPGLMTSTPGKFEFPAELTAGGLLVGWPGAQPPVANPSGTGYVSYPYGYDRDPWGDCTNDANDQPGFRDPQSPRLGISLSLEEPPLGTLIESGKVTGCVYTGPTMLRFSSDATTGNETMTVWSPLTKDTFASRGGNCGVIGTNGDLNNEVTPSGQVVAGRLARVQLTSHEIIWVQSLPADASDPNYWATVPETEAGAPTPGCIDPWVGAVTFGVTGTACTEGDAIVGGTVGARVTVGAEDNVVISRSLEYSCALEGPVTDPRYSSTLRGCGSSKIELGLVADEDVWLNNEVGAALCTDNSDLAAASLRWANLAPDCDVQNPIVDAAIGASSGFFEVQNWRYGTAQDGTLTVNGSMAVNNAAQFGTFDGSGLVSGAILALNWDARLDREQPPGL